jgi:hypothetical protein
MMIYLPSTFYYMMMVGVIFVMKETTSILKFIKNNKIDKYIKGI